MGNGNESPPPLGSTPRDEDMGLVSAAVGLIPLAGGILNELIKRTIPQQRTQRIEAFLRYLDARLDGFKEDALKRRLTEPTAVDLFEDGAHHSIRALTDNRIESIATMVANGISGDERDRIEAKRLLNLLNEIDDAQLVIVASHLHKNQRNEEFHSKHEAILQPVRAHMGSTQEELDREVEYKLARSQLVKLGLLELRYRTLKKGEVPEYGSDGMPRGQGIEITPLGRLLLRRAGLIGSDDL